MSVSVLPPSLHLFAPPLEVVGADLDVPVLPAGRRRFVNLDLAATTPCLAPVWQAITEALPWYGSVHRGAGLPSEVTSARFEHARRVVATFVGARPDDTVVFTGNTTGALNLLAHCLPPEATVLSFSSEHHANLLPWPEARTIRLAIPNSPQHALRLVEQALADTTGERLVCFAGASNVTGEVWPIAELTALAHAAGARVAVDGAQLVAHRQVDITRSGVDYIALSGHKLYAPLGVGALVGRADWLRDAPPFLKGGGATVRVGPDEIVWRESEGRHEAGTPNAIGVLALAAACGVLTESGMRRIEGREAALRVRLQRGLDSITGLRVLELWPGHHDRVGVLTFTLDGWDGPHLASVLSAEHAVGVRAGKFCAHLLVDHLLGVQVGSRLSGGRADPVRVSWGGSTQPADIDRIVKALAAITTQGPQCEYENTATGWHPCPDLRPACW